jgi:hypothetical protein
MVRSSFKRSIRHVDDLAPHGTVTVVKDDDGVFERSAPWGTASLGDLLVGCS